MKRPLIIHIGFPRTATSYLQQHIFPGIEEVHYVDRFDVSMLGAGYDYFFNVDAAKKQLNDLLCDKKNIISNEALVGSIWLKFVNSKMYADRLHAVKSDAKIIITVRNQVDFLPSLYVQYIKEGGVKNFQRFSNIRCGNCGISKKIDDYTVNLDMFLYSKLIDYYVSLFGRENVLVLPFELLVEDSMLFFDKLFNFIGIDFVGRKIVSDKRINMSYGVNQVVLHRFLNRFVATKFKEYTIIPEFSVSKAFKLNSRFFRKFFETKLSRIILGEKQFVLSDELSSYIKSYYSESNKKMYSENFPDLSFIYSKYYR